MYTNLDWNNVIQQESQFGKNLVPKTYSDNWKNTTPGQYNVEVDSGWVDSSELAVKYAMDPRNFLNEVRIFQFETLSYNSSAFNKPAFTLVPPEALKLVTALFKAFLSLVKSLTADAYELNFTRQASSSDPNCCTNPFNASFAVEILAPDILPETSITNAKS